MTKFLSDDWLYENGFLDESTITDIFTPKLVPSRAWGGDRVVGDLVLNHPVTLSSHNTVKQAITKLQSLQFH